MARRFLSAPRRSFEDLAAMPRLGPIKVHSGKFAGVRMWRVSGFEAILIFYHELADGIAVDSCHPRQPGLHPRSAVTPLIY